MSAPPLDFVRFTAAALEDLHGSAYPSGSREHELQALAVTCGLLEAVQAEGPCVDDPARCICMDSWSAFPQPCFRTSPTMAALRAQL
jgi:hypothetical protein